MNMKLTPEAVADALPATGAILSDTAKVLGVTRQALFHFLEKHPELQALRADVEEEMLDVAESWVVAAIKAGDQKMIRWYLDRKGKSRGYTVRVESTGADGRPIEFSTIKREVVDPTEDGCEFG